MNHLLKAAFAASALTLLSGCASLSGYDASSDFACKAQPGVSCKSVTGIHQNSLENNLPSQQENSALPGDESGDVDTKASKTEAVKLVPRITGQAIKSGTPLYQKPVTLRVWLAPWEDKNQVLHDQSFSYLLIQKAQWEVEHFKEAKYRTGLSINQ
ncbi:TraV family lipoprotein [Thiomicrorhabdus aquaedulcis]|uniref:TraV family lipoprotein n=1 Tax=Thiomicrorhabdus aquaedulcis TaxID=2211106 RepID=UPI000FD86EA5|nr:TraV family lipoprotein [Thiomicrorhabdus aquaedulcis]